MWTSHATETTTKAPRRTGKNRKTGCCIDGVTTINNAVAHAGGWRQRAACMTSSASAIATIAATSRYPPISRTTPSATAAEKNCPATTFQVRETVIFASIKIIAIDAANGRRITGRRSSRPRECLGRAGCRSLMHCQESQSVRSSGVAVESDSRRTFGTRTCP